MEKNYISENIEFLVQKSKVSMDEFGKGFELNRGIISQYIRGISSPKIETLIKICDEYSLTLDEIVRVELSKKNNPYSQSEINNVINEPPNGFGLISLKYVETLEKSILDKEKLIEMFEEKIKLIEKSKSA